ncbi:hypothetical protein [Peptostreptococcus anaerobius]|uniref:hypothetical protein n=1 Tax=Peptostreptococcus anaerobius TaxID=1261 RepID=UPI0024304505|nr:hypothetical protein [Peptostreptococcus anaerobius]
MRDKEDFKGLVERKKIFLKRYKKNKACIERLRDKIKLIDEKLGGPKPIDYSGMPRGGQGKDIDDYLTDKEELEVRVLKLEVKGEKFRRDILDEIDNLSDPRYCEVLEEFCINCKGFDEIAEKCNYTTRHVTRLYMEAIRELAYFTQ